MQWLVTKAPVLCFYDPSKNLTIQWGASQSGLGTVILQNGRPMEHVSRSFTATETWYAQIYKYTIVFALEHLNQYTFG